MNPDDRLAIALWAARPSCRRAVSSAGRLGARPALDMVQLERDRLRLRLDDQILFRFTELQEALGERLVPATLQQLAESFEVWPMCDRLKHLEKLG